VVPFFVMLVAMVAVFFVLIVRPQRRQVAAHQALIGSLTVGEEIMTTSGLFGTIRGIKDETLDVEIATGVTVKIARRAVARRVTEPTDEPSEPSEPSE